MHETLPEPARRDAVSLRARAAAAWLARHELSFTLAGCALVVLAFTYPLFEGIDSGLDMSWHTGLFMGVHDGLVFGRSIVFTYGPLGFLKFPALYYTGLSLGAWVYVAVVRLVTGGLLAWAGYRFLTRRGLSGMPETLARLPRLDGLDEPARVAALLEALEPGGPDGHTTNLCVVDRDGSACVLTTSLGLGSGDWLPGLDLHLNSMLGEVDLVTAPLEPGERMQSMMAPSLALDERGGLELAIGAAGGTRLRTALVGVAAAILDEGLEPAAAVERPRFHAVGGIVHVEPGVDEDALAELERRGLGVRRWPARHHYFGGVSAVGRRGAAADPRRSGAARRPG